ncbi:MAG: hypothetical protein GY952_17390 [Rhodobacteraceae bacterium]|nr:hypothetical protein [Paracoccaceae bacterium]
MLVASTIKMLGHPGAAAIALADGVFAFGGCTDSFGTPEEEKKQAKQQPERPQFQYDPNNIHSRNIRLERRLFNGSSVFCAVPSLIRGLFAAVQNADERPRLGVRGSTNNYWVAH